MQLTFTRQKCLCVDLVHLIYVPHAQYRFLSTGWNNGKCYYGTSHPSRWWVSHCSIGFIDQWSHSSFPQNSLGSSRINSNDSLSSSTLTRRIVPFRVLKNNWTTIIRIKQQLKLTQGLFFDLMQSCIVTWCRIFREGSNLNIEIHKHFKQPKFLKSKCASQDDLL